MKAVVQRTKRVALSVDGALVSEIEKGFAVYFGVAKGDGEDKADYLAKKVSALRVFEDENGKMNLSLKEVGGEILLISQFTLLADLSHGNRPGFSEAEEPLKAKELYEYFGKKLEEYGVIVKYGVFGADMKIEQFNDGPVTLIYEI
ncbi:MAG: D-tyrosyl-tRNA(Tyr) deacylase [Clostridia bacterium]|nr:D-tyrosyl-tRNA(Tyr) deacylase [Clostridia bacterium]